MKNSHLVAPVFLAGDYHLPQMQSAPYVIVTNGADRFTLYSNFLPIDRCGEGDGAGDVEVVGESAAVYLFGQAVYCSLSSMVTSLRVCHLRIPVKVPSALNVSRSKKRPLTLMLDMPRPGDNWRVLLPQLFRLLVRLLVSPLRVAAARGEGDEGKEDGDDGFLHIHFVFILLVP